ncbi:flavin reductase family protein [Arthrobacter sp. NPDC056886]|uniref:flavin reductase family protein n=1 Tax=Arthrobacter sp. NPDC056886 TaxID=3345960 RepID=UPI00366DDC24
MIETRKSPTPADLRQFRAAMANVVSPVSVVTTLDTSRPMGTTVSAFASLSLHPPMVMVSLDRQSELLSRLAVGSRLGLNVLGAHQEQIARRFASKIPDRYADTSWQIEDGAPRIQGAHSFVSLDVSDMVPAGDHVIVLGTVSSASGDSRAGAPLSYYRQKYGTHHPI